MSVKDMIKKSVLESGAFTNYDVPGILTALAAALLLGALIYLVYRKFYAGVVFFKNICCYSGWNDSAYLYGNLGYQYQCGNFTWYGRSVVHCPFSYSN